MHGLSNLPPWPVRTACSYLMNEFDNDDDLFVAIRKAVSVYFNNTGDVPCYGVGNEERVGPEFRAKMGSPLWAGQTVHARDGTCEGSWGYQWCTEMVQPFTSGTPKVRLQGLLSLL